MNTVLKNILLIIPLWSEKPDPTDVTGTWSMHSTTSHRWEKEVRLIQAGEKVLGESWDRSSGVRGRIQAQIVSNNQVVGVETYSNGQRVDFRWVASKAKLEGWIWHRVNPQEIRAVRLSGSVPVFEYLDRSGMNRK